MSHETHEHPTPISALLQANAERKLWQSLEELAQQADFTTFLNRERPREAAILERSGMDRRTFLKLMGAAFALTGLSGCTPKPPDQPIIPYVRKPEAMVLGIPLFFASTMTLGGYATGVVIETHEGRPTRVEGNPEHPASLGGSDPLLLASILELYNPDRSTAVRNKGAVGTWDDFMKALPSVLAAGTVGGLRILTETVTSPTLTSQLQALLKKYPSAKWHQYEPVGQDMVVAGSRLAFGDEVNTIYHFDKADVVLALDADFMSTFPGSLRYAREFIDRRRVRGNGQPVTMNRLYAVESTPTITGATADHRLPLRASQIERFARAVAQALSQTSALPASPDWDSAWFNTLVADLQAHRGTSLVVPGNEQPAAVHAIAHAINAALGNVGNTVTYTASAVSNPVIQADDLGQLVKDMQAGQVKALIILGGNPAYNAPADIAFATALQKTPFTAHLSMYYDETSALCQWHLPESHYIEAWSDARAFDGTVSLSQPPIGPLYADTHSAHELLALLLQDKRVAYDILRAYWQGVHGNDQFDLTWQSTLESGVWADSALPPIQPTLRADLAKQLGDAPAAPTGIDLIFRPDPTVWDGRFAANSWLQELPKPLTKLTWDNAALFSPALAARLKVANEDLVELHYQGRMVQAPVWILPGHTDNAVTVTLGYGRTQGGEVGLNAGFNAYALRTAAAPWFGSGLEIRPTNQKYKLATTQQHFRMDGRDPVQVATLSTFLKEPNFAHAEEHGPAITLLPKDNYEGNAWGMSIDLTACIGCNACVIACQSENNIPTVGKEEVMRSREMHWIRVDRYYADDEANPNTYFQPVPCMHCEKAPCEMVCPVQATTHSSEGLNQMVYNRCVGTRYCSGNCPYNVRHFNFLDWTDYTPILEEMRNPNVTVRTRGVMEKCSYCVQRIDQARITADKENRPIKDGEVMPACAAACPTRAIVFGNINDRQSQVTELKSQPHDYSLLAELNTKPRTTYLARLTNPNETVGS